MKTPVVFEVGRSLIRRLRRAARSDATRQANASTAPSQGRKGATASAWFIAVKGKGYSVQSRGAKAGGGPLASHFQHHASKNAPPATLIQRRWRPHGDRDGH